MIKIIRNAYCLFLILPLFISAQVSVDIPDTSVVNSNSIAIPIYVSKLDGFNIRSYEFHLKYDSNILRFRDIIENGTLSNRRTWNISTDTDKSGLTVDAGGWTTLSGSGVLIYISFDILVDDGKTDLELDKFKFNYFNYPQAIIDNGSFKITSYIEISFIKAGEGNGNISIDEEIYNLPLKIKLKKNKSYNLKARPYSSSLFDKWTGAVSTKSNPIEYKVENSAEIIVNYNLKTFNLSSNINPEGFGNVEGVGIYKYGDLVHLIANPYAGKEFLNWTIDDEIVGDSTYLEFEIKSDIEITANFVSSFYQITANTNPIEAGQISGTGLYYPDQMVELTAFSNENWTFSNWTENGEVISEDSILYFIVTDNRSLTANFNVLTHIDETNVDLHTYLNKPFPNPFNPSTTFSFTLASPSRVKLFIVDPKGSIVQKLVVNEFYNKGIFSKRFDTRNLASGVYFYYFEALKLDDKSTHVDRGKLVLLK